MKTRIITLILLFAVFGSAGFTSALHAQDVYLTSRTNSITKAMIAGGCASGTGLNRFAHFSEVLVNGVPVTKISANKFRLEPIGTKITLPTSCPAKASFEAAAISRRLLHLDSRLRVNRKFVSEKTIPSTSLLASPSIATLNPDCGRTENIPHNTPNNTPKGDDKIVITNNRKWISYTVSAVAGFAIITLVVIGTRRRLNRRPLLQSEKISAPPLPNATEVSTVTKDVFDPNGLEEELGADGLFPEFPSYTPPPQQGIHVVHRGMVLSTQLTEDQLIDQAAALNNLSGPKDDNFPQAKKDVTEFPEWFPHQLHDKNGTS